MKKFFLLCALVCTVMGASGPLTLRADLKRTSADLLDPVGIAIWVTNHSKSPVTAHFTTADTYDIAIRLGGHGELWRWSAVHASAQVLRSLTFAPASMLLVTHYWDALAGGRSVPSGDLVAHITLVDRKYHPSIDLPIHFALPAPISAARMLPLNSAVTIAGMLHAKGTTVELVDDTGSIALSKRIATQAPEGIFVVRGYLTKANGEQFLTVERWARAFDNVAPSPTPTP